MIRRVILAGGGTGGHLFPGVAVVEELRRRRPEVEVTFVGTEKGIEARVLPARGERLELLDVGPLKGKAKRELVHNLLRVPGAYREAVRLARRLEPDLVIGVGGYAAGPMLLAAASLRIPTAILEQNAHVGLTNRLLAPVVGRAYVAFDEAAVQIGKKARRLGNPVRRAFVDASRAAMIDPDGFEARAEAVLVLGGSQGARTINRVVPEALARLDLSARGVRVVHQTGPAMLEEVRARYASLGVDAEVVPFIEDVARAFTSASLVIARAGATTLAELCAIGRPSVLIPFPFAADDHQAKNAEALERAGAAVSIREEALDEDRLSAEVGRLLRDRDARRAMAEAARRHGRPEAAAAIVDDLYAWLSEPPASETRAEGFGDPEPPAGTGGGGGRARGLVGVRPSTRPSPVTHAEARFGSVDFRAGRDAGLTPRRRSSHPPPTAYLSFAPPPSPRIE